MKLAVICANGKSGKLITKEALSRGIDVTAVVRGENRSDAKKAIVKDLFDLTKDDLKGFNAVADAFGAWTPDTIGEIPKAVEHLCRLLSGTPTRLLIVGGADLLDGTPIYDIKPYLPYVDSHPDARGGFSAEHADYALSVHISPELMERIPQEKREALTGVLAGDPRPSYQNDPSRVYGVNFAGMNVKFTVDGLNLTVIGIEK